jgi:hypothetical protein
MQHIDIRLSNASRLAGGFVYDRRLCGMTGRDSGGDRCLALANAADKAEA